MPFPFLALAISAAFAVAGQLLAPRPKSAKPASLAELEFPTATESRPRPYFFGTVEHKSPNTVWWGDYSTKSIKTGGILTFFIKTVGGYKYFVGFNLALALGEFDALRKIIIGDKIAWEGTIKDGTIDIDKPELFGKAKQEGGFQSTVEVYSGTPDQSASAYMRSKCDPDYPPYRRVSHLVFRGLNSTSKGAYIGNAARLEQMKLVLQRFPNSLGVTGGKHIIDSDDANPVCVLYDVLTSEDEFGAGYVASDFNLTNWRAAAEVCHTEGLGISGLLDSIIDVEKLLDELLNVIDAVINQNLETAEFELDLARANYNPFTIPTLTQDDILSYDFERTSWLDNVNSLKLSYIDRENAFKQRDITISNTAMLSIQQESRSQGVDVKFISTGANATKIAFREMAILTLPLARVKLTVNRKAYNFRVGTPFKLVNTPYNVNNIVLRATKVDLGDYQNGKITIEAVEDVFGLSLGIFAAPTPTGWIQPTTTPTNITSTVIQEQPRFFHASDATRIMTLADKPNGAQQDYKLFAKDSAATEYIERLDNVPFTPLGTLTDALTMDADTFTVSPVSETEDLDDSIDPVNIRQGDGLLLINNEILAYESYTTNIDGDLEFTGVWRGLLDSVPMNHAGSSTVRFLSAGAGVPETEFAANSTVNIKMASQTASGELALASCTAFNLTTDERAMKPYPPADMTFVDTSHYE